METYMEATTLFLRWLEAEQLPTAADRVERAHVEGFITDLLARFKPATASNRYRALARFFAFLVEEGEITESPMAKMRPPTIPETTVPVIPDPDLKKLLAACAGTDFAARRDTAIIRLLVDSGMRASECVNLRVDDLDLDLSVAVVLGKGRRPRSTPFGSKTGVAIDRYLRVRARHQAADMPWLWLGRQGRMTYAGLRQLLERRATEAGIGHIHAHQLRHSFASAYLSQGGNEGDLMVLAGWRSRAMLNRYGAHVAADRAREAYRRSGVGDRL
ncbi:tyrosine-type recombinase/integrase [Acidiferrimicrobium sp. IK]|nr:tyrosine-type recombinase/integrase [Acidiferrimicrobium sp. IK]